MLAQASVRGSLGLNRPVCNGVYAAGAIIDTDRPASVRGGGAKGAGRRWPFSRCRMRWFAGPRLAISATTLREIVMASRASCFELTAYLARWSYFATDLFDLAIPCTSSSTNTLLLVECGFGYSRRDKSPADQLFSDSGASPFPLLARSIE